MSILAVDVGNSRIKWGLWDGGWLRQDSVPKGDAPLLADTWQAAVQAATCDRQQCRRRSGERVAECLGAQPGSRRAVGHESARAVRSPQRVLAANAARRRPLGGLGRRAPSGGRSCVGSQCGHRGDHRRADAGRRIPGWTDRARIGSDGRGAGARNSGASACRRCASRNSRGARRMRSQAARCNPCVVR